MVLLDNVFVYIHNLHTMENQFKFMHFHTVIYLLKLGGYFVSLGSWLRQNKNQDFLGDKGSLFYFSSKPVFDGEIKFLTTCGHT